MDISSVSSQKLKLAADTIRVISAEAVEKANSGHPGMPMGAAEMGLALWLSHLKFNPENPDWINRDRFVLSNGHGSMFLYTLLHLSSYDLSIEDLKAFRQLGSLTPGHPESFITKGVEATTGPLGQGISNAVGMAIAERALRERYDLPSSAFGHSTFCMVGDGCLMEGISSEASSLAGHLGLGGLNVLYDDNQISIAGRTDLAFSEDVKKRYESYDWQVLEVDGHDVVAVDQALSQAVSCADKPTLICAKTIIGKGSPGKADTSGVHGSPLGGEELAKTKEALGWEYGEFEVPAEVKELFAQRLDELKTAYSQWEEDFSSWKSDNPEVAKTFEAHIKGEVPAGIIEKFVEAAPGGAKAATRKTSATVLQVAASEIPSLYGGSADLEPSCLTVIKEETSLSKESFKGRNIHFGVREHAMGAIMNGLSYYGGFIPFGSTFLCFSDYMRPAIRIAALSGLRSLFVFTHDSVFLGEDGPTHQPIEHVNSLRMIPNLNVFRPADDLEVAVAYEQSLKRQDGPSALILTRQGLEPLERNTSSDAKDVAKGAYTVFENLGSKDQPDIVFVASGSEVPTSIAASKLLPSDLAVRVVSMPCFEIFDSQEQSYKSALVPDGSKVVSVEAGTSFGWHSILANLGSEQHCVSIDKFGTSAPLSDLETKYKFTAEQIRDSIVQHYSLL